MRMKRISWKHPARFPYCTKFMSYTNLLSNRGERKRMDNSAVPSEERGYFEQVDPPFVKPTGADPLMEHYSGKDKDGEFSSCGPYEKNTIGSRGEVIHDKRYRAIVENSMDNIYICDAKTGKIIESNRSMQQLLGYSEEEMLELSAFDFLDHSKENIERHIGIVLEEGYLKVRNRRYRRKDGSLVDIEATCVLIRENDRELLCVVSRDITDRIEYERMLCEERNRAEFYLDILCHDIGNLHQGIVGFVKLCKEFEEDPKRAKKCIENIEALSLKSINLSNNLKTLAGIGISQDKKIEIDLNRIIKSSINTVRSSIPWKEPIFEVDMPEKVYITANPAIEFALYNVIHNAVRYQLDLDPLVQITCRETGKGYIRITVLDKGSGIPHSLRKEILNRDNLSKKHGGLGLLVVRTLVEKSDGEVRIKEGERGQGTVIEIELPLSMTYNNNSDRGKISKRTVRRYDRANMMPVQYL